MTLHYEDGGLRLFHGSNKDILPTFADASFDSIVTDPPYELGFMGKRWDSTGIAYDVDLWREAYRVLKPGGHLLAFGGTRTWHRIAAAIEDAGFEIRDSIAWMYGSGFPKSMDVAKAIDKRPGVGRHEEFKRELIAAREAAGLSRRDVAEHVVGTDSGAVWNWEHHQFPSARWWPTLRDLLGMDGSKWDNVIAEAERAKTGKHRSGLATGSSGVGGAGQGGARFDEPATEAGKAWAGWGTALKPAFEPIIVARKPLGGEFPRTCVSCDGTGEFEHEEDGSEVCGRCRGTGVETLRVPGTVAANVLAYGTGAINIDACRVPTTDTLGGGAATGAGLATKSEGWSRPWMSDTDAVDAHADRVRENIAKAEALGRFPSNVLLDESQAAALDAQTGVLTSGLMKARTERQPRKGGTIYGADQRNITAGATYGDSGGASRFFPTFRYEAKAPSSERPSVAGVAHATVKPLDLMRWLVRLVTRRGGHVLDLFAGSGTTGEAALLEGMECTLIELEADHLPLILARVRKPLQPSMFGDWEGGAA